MGIDGRSAARQILGCDLHRFPSAAKGVANVGLYFAPVYNV